MPFNDHIKIAIACWSRMRARQCAEKALKVSPNDMETFLAELLKDALMTFNDDYNRSSADYIARLENSVTEIHNLQLPPTVFIKKEK